MWVDLECFEAFDVGLDTRRLIEDVNSLPFRRALEAHDCGNFGHGVVIGSRGARAFNLAKTSH